MAYGLQNIVKVTRANFLPLAVVITATNLAAAFYSHGAFNIPDAFLVLFGAVLLHASVNAFNNYFDYRSGIDARTHKTPFSGGVETLVRGEMKASSALLVAISSLVLAGLIGTYFLFQFFIALIPIVVYGTVAIVLYTPVIAKIYGLSEIVAGTGFGVMGLGVYVTQAGHIDLSAVAIFVPTSILVDLLLFLNEFPDVEADRTGGRKHLVIILGNHGAAKLYVAAVAATYISILAAVQLGIAPFFTLLAFLSIPIAYKACKIVLKQHDNMPNLLPALGLNVMMILLTIALIGAGFLIAKFL